MPCNRLRDEDLIGDVSLLAGNNYRYTIGIQNTSLAGWSCRIQLRNEATRDSIFVRDVSRQNESQTRFIVTVTSSDTTGLSGRHILGTQLTNATTGDSVEALIRFNVREDWVS